jgi:dipeptidyl aminopeptidase/acylaminoacyl peptidase
MQSSISPDGAWVAFTKDGNLWVRSIDDKVRFALTTDGEARNAYGVMIEAAIASEFADGQDHAVVDATGRRDGLIGPIVVVWSPDSRRLFASRVDERKVREITNLQSAPEGGSARAIPSSWRMAQPNDAVLPTAEPWVFDLANRTARKVQIDPIQVSYLTPAEAHEAWWSPDGRRLNLLVRSRYAKSLTFYDVDAATGAARKVLSEGSKTFIEAAGLGEAPMVYVLKSGDILWFSERDGYGGLYLYGPNGALKRRLTKSGWTVRNVLRVDEAKGFIYVAGNEREPGADPYFRKVYQISLSRGRIKLLTPEDADHDVASSQANAPDLRARATPDDTHGFSPSGTYFVESLYRTDTPSRTLLRAADGRLIGEVEHTDISRLSALGFSTPERFHTLAADGKTAIYGNILRPFGFDPAKHYPILDAVYPGPQRPVTRPRFESAVFDSIASEAYAELGFIVVMLDGRGAAGRSKAFHDLSYGQLSRASDLDDHVSAIKQLAGRYPYFDLERVGVFGTSAGGYAAAHAMLARPDFFKVAVADAGNHDQKGMIAYWGETYNGPEVGRNYADASNVMMADRLQGKLMLAQGDLDTNVPPAVTLQFVNALIKANKDFTLVIAPNIGHGVNIRRGYGLVRAWNFMIANLMGATPPEGYVMPPPVQ